MMGGVGVALRGGARLVSVYAGRLADAQGLREQHAEQSSRQEPPTLQQSAGAGLIGLEGAGDTSWGKATWAAPSGGNRTRRNPVPLNPRKGEGVNVWGTPTGVLTHPPLTRADLRDPI